MTEEKQQRRNRMPSSAKKQRADKMLNYLIVFMILLILITITIIVKNAGSEPEPAKELNEQPIETVDKQPVKEDDEQDEVEQAPVKEKEETLVEGDPIVASVIVDPAWEPTPTTQTGEHVSLYVASTDWQEKIETLSRTTGLAHDNMIVLRVGNNGGTQNAIGVVTSADGTEKYRVSMEWVDEQGWLPTKLEKLHTTEGAY
ncbi:hypothetical protein BN1050_00379 [Metalysinibacillus saudimassiliensis]|uniref:DUF1510 domain-containing protein n=1 Tax=Metalysinibacillus saudimassiliensis TaxID=1461583 RepID=A0A078M5G4_9BACL|nr:hypothetical protein BN1050_00379 [Metalysinibacillus saudimassiliensis]